MQERQECWTAGLEPELIVAGGIADGASDVQSAGRRAFGVGLDGTDDDMNRCQNHMMKGAYEVLEKAVPEFKAAIDATVALFVSVSNSANVNEMLRASQHVNETSTAALYVYNDTRWEGRLRLLECALRLRASLPCLKEYATRQPRLSGRCVLPASRCVPQASQGGRPCFQLFQMQHFHQALGAAIVHRACENISAVTRLSCGAADGDALPFRIA